MSIVTHDIECEKKNGLTSCNCEDRAIAALFPTLKDAVAARELVEAHAWTTEHDICVQRVGYHEEVEGVPPHQLGWCVLTDDGKHDAFAETFIAAVTALRAKLKEAEG